MSETILSNSLFSVSSFPFSFSFLDSVSLFALIFSSSLFDPVTFRSDCLVVRLLLDLSFSVLFYLSRILFSGFLFYFSYTFPFPSFESFVFLCSTDLSLIPPQTMTLIPRFKIAVLPDFSLDFLDSLLPSDLVPALYPFYWLTYDSLFPLLL